MDDNKNSFKCPLTDEIITGHNCYEISLVAEEIVKETFISKRFTQKENYKEICLNCPHHDTN